MQVITIRAGGDSNFAYLLLPEGGGEAYCVDPSFAAAALLEACAREGREITDVLLTHTHADHRATLGIIQDRASVRVWVHPAEKGSVPGSTPLPGEGAIPGLAGVGAIFTPGHTPGGVCYLAGGDLFTGDTLFVDWVGRADFQGGDPRALFASLGKIRNLPGSLAIRPGHDYGEVPSRTLAEEIARNRFLACEDYGTFIRLLPELV